MNFKKNFGVILIFAVPFLPILLFAAFTNTTKLFQYTGGKKELRDTIPARDTSVTRDSVFQKVEAEAYFPDGSEGWKRFLEKNLNPNVPADKGAPDGTYTVYVQFIVAKDGTLSDIKALTKHGFGMENEVIRIIKKSPPWIPAEQAGRKVNAYRKQPVTFQITTEGKKKKRRT
jgi:Gram-negative bacterial TonB protein C-terminal